MTFRDNPAQSRFELDENGATVIADYRRKDKTLYIDFVEAPPALRGTGAAGRIMSAIMDTARREGLEVVPICGYAASWISRHPEK